VYWLFGISVLDNLIPELFDPLLFLTLDFFRTDIPNSQYRGEMEINW
jgi:hypothetical protein